MYNRLLNPVNRAWGGIKRPLVAHTVAVFPFGTIYTVMNVMAVPGWKSGRKTTSVGTSFRPNLAMCNVGISTTSVQRREKKQKTSGEATNRTCGIHDAYQQPIEQRTEKIEQLVRYVCRMSLEKRE